MTVTPPRGDFFSRLDPAKRFETMLVASFFLHLLLVFGVGFSLPTPKFAPSDAHSIDVVLVNKKSTTRPTHSDTYAQANLEGGGTVDTERHAKSPLPVLDDSKSDTAVTRKQQRVQELEEQARRLASDIRSVNKVETARSSRKNSPSPRLDAADLLQSSFDAAKLQAQIDKDMDAYNKRPRKAFVGASAQEYVLARYLEDWRMKVEKVGNLNYPEEAKRQKLYGSLRLTVEINADGSVRNIELNRSSGHKELDEAALRIVRLAAPYAPFSTDIRSKYDVISITRTWMFTKSDQLQSQ